MSDLACFFGCEVFETVFSVEVLSVVSSFATESYGICEMEVEFIFSEELVVEIFLDSVFSIKKFLEPLFLRF